MNFRFKLSRRLARIKPVAVFTGTLILGCNLSSGPVVDRIESISVAPIRIALMPYQTAPLTVVAVSGHGDSTAAMSLQWSTTGGTISNNGIVKGVDYITYTAPAQAGNYLLVVTTSYGTPADTARIGVTVTAVPVNTVAVAPSSVTLALSDTTTLRATLTDSTGSALFGRAITWTSSNDTVASVLATGFVRAMGVGTATITASVEGHSGTATVTVTP
ncbi:MAG TPA: Ig-like domain-containing protein [Gemmatimonadales bacterium]|nr:Ig-like domain-containing protein [Gemmatimonadales bacterium]